MTIVDTFTRLLNNPTSNTHMPGGIHFAETNRIDRANPALGSGIRDARALNPIGTLSAGPAPAA